MEMLGKVLKLKNADAVSVHQTTHYRKLRQDITDDERDDEDDDVVFLRKGIELKQQNGFDVDHMKLVSDSELDLKSSIKSRMSSTDGIQVKQVAPKKGLIKRRKTFMLLALIVALVTISALVVLSLHRHRGKPSSSWMQEFTMSEGTSNIILYDVDMDGILDVIFSFVVNLDSTSGNLRPQTPSQAEPTCVREENKTPCLGRLMSIRGRDGEILWTLMIRHGLRSIRCKEVDIDGDQMPDCVGSGYSGTLMAFSPKTGQAIWTSNSSALNWDQLVIGTEFLPDVNGDGTADLVAIETTADENGVSGDSHNDTEEQSSLLLVDGSSGSILGQPIKVKGGSRFSPVVHKFKDQSVYIFFGLGSQTKAGSLNALSMRDFYSLAVSPPLVSKPLVTDSSTFKISQAYLTGFESMGSILKIIKSQGVIIPPLFLDADGDGEEDILVASCDGSITLFGGARNRVVWSASFSEHHVTREMTLGHFDGDGHPDVLVFLNLKYHSNVTAPSSAVAILSGLTGTLFWSLNDTSVEFDAHNFKVSTTEDRRDMFMFWLKRQKGLGSDDAHQRDKRYIRDSETPFQRTHFPNNKWPHSSSYEDYFSERGIPQANGYDPVDRDYRTLSDYGPDSDQPLPRRRFKAYPPDYYNQPDEVEVPMLRPPHKMTKIPTTTDSSVKLTSSPSTRHARCQSQSEQSFLVGVDRHSVSQPFVITHKDALSSHEVDEFASNPGFGKGSSFVTCSTAEIRSSKGIIGDVDGDQKVDMVIATNFWKRVKDSKAEKKLQISKLNLQVELLKVITRRFESLTNPFLRPPSLEDFSPLEASLHMTKTDLSRYYSNFELLREFQNEL